MKHILLAAVLLLAAWATLSLLKTSVIQPAAPLAENSAPAKGATAEAPASPGKTLFAANCASCHGLDRALTGPALRGFTARGPWADRKEVYKWVHNPAAYMAKDPYTKALQQQYGAVMTAFPQLPEGDIDQIVDYIEGK